MPCRNDFIAKLSALTLRCGLLLCVWPAGMAHANTPALPEAWEPIAAAVKLWGEKNHPGETALGLAEINDRVQPAACDAELQVDAPFRQSTNLRVRCPSPGWQLFVLTTHQGKASATEVVSADKPIPVGQWVVPQVHLTRGTRLTADMLKVVPAEAGVPGNNTLDALEQAVGAELVRDIAAGKPLRRHDVRAAVLVKRGAMVKLSVGKSNGFQISVRVLAEESARMGEQVKLKNPESGRIITGKVIGLNEAIGL